MMHFYIYNISNIVFPYNGPFRFIHSNSILYISYAPWHGALICNNKFPINVKSLRQTSCGACATRLISTFSHFAVNDSLVPILYGPWLHISPTIDVALLLHYSAQAQLPPLHYLIVRIQAETTSCFWVKHKFLTLIMIPKLILYHQQYFMTK